MVWFSSKIQNISKGTVLRRHDGIVVGLLRFTCQWDTKQRCIISLTMLVPCPGGGIGTFTARGSKVRRDEEYTWIPENYCNLRGWWKRKCFKIYDL